MTQATYDAPRGAAIRTTPGILRGRDRPASALGRTLRAGAVLLFVALGLPPALSAQTTTVTETYDHDDAGRLVRLVRTVGTENSTIRWTWDDAGNLLVRQVDVGAIFLDGFESGDASAWSNGSRAEPERDAERPEPRMATRESAERPADREQEARR